MTQIASKAVLFRCSRLGDLMTDPKTKAAKEAGELSETAKAFVRDIWLEREYGYRERVTTKEMKKGLLCEQDSMALVQSVLGGEFRLKCADTYTNDYLIGHPDIVLKKEDYVEDIKTSWSLRTFMDAELTKAYYAQAHGYMILTGKNNYRLIYCLIPTPPEMILEEEKRIYFQYDCNENNPDYIAAVEQLNHNNEIIKTIPIEKCVKVFEFKRDEDYCIDMMNRAKNAIEFYNTLSL